MSLRRARGGGPEPPGNAPDFEREAGRRQRREGAGFRAPARNLAAFRKKLETTTMEESKPKQPNHTPGPWEENSALAAAAPELLECLKEAVLEYGCGNCIEQGDREVDCPYFEGECRTIQDSSMRWLPSHPLKPLSKRKKTGKAGSQFSGWLRRWQGG